MRHLLVEVLAFISALSGASALPGPSAWGEGLEDLMLCHGYMHEDEDDDEQQQLSISY